MQTITLDCQSSFKEKLMIFLNIFDFNEVKIISDRKEVFEKNKKRVQQSYRKLINNETKLYDIDELDGFLNKTISEYEN